MKLLLAFLLRDARIERAYRFDLAVKAAGVLFQLAVFFFIARYVAIKDYFPFVLAGLAFSRFFQFWLGVFAENVRQEQFWGTAEVLFLAPARSLSVLLASAAGKFAFLATELAAYSLLGAFLFGVKFHVHFAAVLLIMLNAACFAGIGLAAGSFIMAFKRGDPVGWLAGSAADLLSGVYFPVTVLPFGLAAVAKWLPTTLALDGWRASFLNGSFPSLSNLAAQVGWTVLSIAAGLISFQFAYRRTRMRGELGSY